MTKIKARFDGHVFVPEGPVDLPVGCELEIPLPAPPPQGQVDHPLAALVDPLSRFPGNPEESSGVVPTAVTRIKPLAYLRAVWAVMWGTIRYPRLTTIIDLSTGKAVHVPTGRSAENAHG